MLIVDTKVWCVSCKHLEDRGALLTYLIFRLIA